MRRQLSCFDFDFANNTTKPMISPARNNTTHNTPNTQRDKAILPQPTTINEKENIPLPLPLSLSPSIHRQHTAAPTIHDPNINTNRTRIQRVGTGLSIMPRIPPPDIPHRAPGHGVARRRGGAWQGALRVRMAGVEMVMGESGAGVQV